MDKHPFSDFRSTNYARLAIENKVKNIVSFIVLSSFLPSDLLLK